MVWGQYQGLVCWAPSIRSQTLSLQDISVVLASQEPLFCDSASTLNRVPCRDLKMEVPGLCHKWHWTFFLLCVPRTFKYPVKNQTSQTMGDQSQDWAIWKWVLQLRPHLLRTVAKMVDILSRTSWETPSLVTQPGGPWFPNPFRTVWNYHARFGNDFVM